MNAQVKLARIKLDPRSAVPVYEQIMSAVKRLILSGELEKDEKMVPVKELALRLNVNPNTMAKVYYRLELDGYVYALKGRGYFVNYDPSRHGIQKEELFNKAMDEFLSKAFQLGYLPADVAERLVQRLGKDAGDEEG